MKNMIKNPTKDEIQDFIISSYKTLRSQGKIKTWSDFAELLETNRSVLSSAKNGDERYLTESLVTKIQSVLDHPGNYTTINNSSNFNVVNSSNNGGSASGNETVIPAEEEMVPVIPTHLYKESDVNILEYVSENDEDIHKTPAVQQFPKTDLIYSVQTMAMYPHLHQGDLLALKAIRKDTPIINGEMYAVDTVDNGILIRFVYDRGDHIEMRASERADRFESFNINKSDIYTIFRVVGMIRTNI